MANVLETERLVLNEMSLSDLEPFYQYRHDPIVSRYQGFRPQTLDEAREFINRLQPFPFPFEGSIPPGWYQLGIRIKIENGNPILIGDLGVHFFEDDPTAVELGITLAKEFQGRGLATETVKAMINLCFHHPAIARIVCSIDPRNSDCLKMLTKLGFEVVKIEKDAYVLRGESVDDMILHINKPR